MKLFLIFISFLTLAACNNSESNSPEGAKPLRAEKMTVEIRDQILAIRDSESYLVYPIERSIRNTGPLPQEIKDTCHIEKTSSDDTAANISWDNFKNLGEKCPLLFKVRQANTLGDANVQFESSHIILNSASFRFTYGLSEIRTNTTLEVKGDISHEVKDTIFTRTEGSSVTKRWEATGKPGRYTGYSSIYNFDGNIFKVSANPEQNSASPNSYHEECFFNESKLTVEDCRKFGVGSSFSGLSI